MAAVPDVDEEAYKMDGDNSVIFIDYIRLDEYVLSANDNIQVIREDEALRHFVPASFTGTSFKMFLCEVLKANLEGVVAHSPTIFKCATQAACHRLHTKLTNVAASPWLRAVAEGAGGGRLATIILITATSKGCLQVENLNLHVPGSGFPFVW